MSAPRTVPDHSGAIVTIKGDLRHRCPHVEEADHGRVIVAWRVSGQTYELHSLAEYLRGFTDAEISHEQLTDRIRRDLSSVTTDIELLSVETSWDTAGLEVRCSI